MQKVIEICGGMARLPEWRMAAPVDFELCDNENIAITGRNGSGKSMFVEMITGSHPLYGDNPKYDFRPSKREFVSDNIKYMAFTDSYGENDSTYYLQQRWNQQEIDEDTPTVGEMLANESARTGTDGAATRTQQLYNLFGIDRLADRYIISLSSGELRKVLIMKALLSAPRVLIIDNPFIGLDAESREQFKQTLGILCRERLLQIILVVPSQDDIPDYISHVVEVDGMTVGPKTPLAEYKAKAMPADSMPDERLAELIAGLPEKHGSGSKTTEVIRMNNVSIKYGSRRILDNLNWTVEKGEKWAVTGRNGSGKSTLMSLVCADNPQGYACNISLFGQQRGTGESIWEIKKRIGYVSPEMHRAYKKNIATINIVASGLKESVGLYSKPAPDELATCRWWMDIFGLEGKEERPFLKLSSGEQRLALLARAFVKDPELLILDEPLHGLDSANKQKVIGIIEAFCQREGKTLIMISHYTDELPPCIDHTLTLTNGQ